MFIKSKVLYVWYVQLLDKLFFKKKNPPLGFVGAITWLDSVSNRPLKVTLLELYFFECRCLDIVIYTVLKVSSNGHCLTGCVLGEPPSMTCIYSVRDVNWCPRVGDLSNKQCGFRGNKH